MSASAPGITQARRSNYASPPSAAEDRAALERIAESPQLRASPRLVAFLRYVVDRTLVGHSAQIKSYTIAVEAFGRHPSFDPEADPIVRVEAGRLRRAMARYYSAPGCDDPLMIDLPRGSYVPLFSWRAAAAPTGPPAHGARAEFAAGGIAEAIGLRTDHRAALRAVSERLSELRLQIEAMAADIEVARKILEHSG